MSAVQGMALIYRRDNYERTLLKQNPGDDLDYYDDRVFRNGSTIVFRGVRKTDAGYYAFYANPNYRGYCVVNLSVIPREGKLAYTYRSII